jgi:hypothetical protein
MRERTRPLTAGPLRVAYERQASLLHSINFKPE